MAKKFQGMPRGGGQGGMNMNALLKQAQKMQAQLEEAQLEAKDISVDASAGGGMVKVSASGDMKITNITIDPAALDPDDVELLQDMLMAAINDALTSASEATNNKVAEATGMGDMGGLGIPGLF